MTQRKFTPPTEYPAEYMTVSGDKATILGVQDDGICFSYIGYVAGDYNPLAWSSDGKLAVFFVGLDYDLHN